MNNLTLRPGEKSIHEVTIEDFDLHPIWDTARFDVGGGIDQTVVPLPGHVSLTGHERMPWVRVRGVLADGTAVVGIANAFFDPPRLFGPELSWQGKWLGFLLPPAPEASLRRRGPEVLAAKLERAVDRVFPIVLSSEVPWARTGAPITTVFTVHGPEGA